MTQSKELSTVVVEMTTAEAQAAHEALRKTFMRAGREMDGLLLDMHDRVGYKRLGCPTFGDYIKKIEADFGAARRSVYNWMGLLRVERALQAATGKTSQVPLRHGLVLAPLAETPELVAEAYKEAGGNEVKLKRIVERFLIKIRPASKKTEAQHEKGESGWTKEDLDDDKDLRDALDKIGGVFGREDRKAIQDGIIGMPRKEILTLAKLDAPTMEKVHYLVISRRWGVEKSLAFVNDMPTDESTVADLKNHCLTTKGLYWTGTFGGYEISVKATAAVKKRL